MNIEEEFRQANPFDWRDIVGLIEAFALCWVGILIVWGAFLWLR